MKKQIILILTLVLVFSGLGFAKKRKIDKLKFPKLKEFKIPKVEKSDTPNGIKIRYIKNDKLPLVNLVAIFKGGSVFEPMDKVGLAGITARLMRIGGVADMNGEAVDAYLDSNGVTIGVSASLDFYRVNLSCMEENLDSALQIMAKILRKPAFDKEKLEEIKTQSSSGIQRRNDQPQPILTREFGKVIYGKNTPFSSVMEYEHLDNITVDEIKKTYRQYFAPGNMLVGVSGPVGLKKIQGLIEKHLGDWQHKVKVPAYPKVKKPKNDFKLAFAHKDNLNQNYISVGYMGKKEEKEMQPVISVFNSIFSRGMESRLFTRLRTNMGLTYGVRGGIFQNKWYPGMTYFSSFTKSESTVDMIKAMFDEIEKIKKGKVTPKELDDAKNYFLNSYVFKFSTPEQILFSKISDEIYGEEENAQKELLDKIQKVTAEDVLKLANDYLHPDKMTIVIVGNKKKTKADLSQFGKVKDLDIKIKPPVIKEKIPAATPETLEKGKTIVMNLYKKAYRGYKRLKTIKSSFDMEMTMGGRKMTLGMTSTRVYPDKSHMEISVMGMKMTTVINGNKGIMNQMGRKMPISEKQIKDGRFGDEYDMYHNRKDYQFQFLKEVEIKGQKYDLVYVKKGENWKKLYINKKTGFIEITESVSNQPPAIGLIKTISSDFKIIKGIAFPFKSVSMHKGKVSRSMKMKSVNVNIKVGPKLFEIKK